MNHRQPARSGVAHLEVRILQYSSEPAGRLWLIGGTQESAQLVAAIAQNHVPCTVTVTTEAAKELYPQTQTLRVWVGCLSIAQLGAFCHEQQIVAILDASHPFALEISQLAITAARDLQIPYLRYERPTVEAQPDALSVIHLDSFETLLANAYLEQARVLLTVGYKALSLFRPWQDRSTLFARILPSVTAIEAALAAGFTPDRLFAMRPPISAELEKALWQHWDISVVVTKASGTAGGEDIKRALAAELGVRLIVITRPPMAYPQQTSDLSVALEFCEHHIWSGSPPS